MAILITTPAVHDGSRRRLRPLPRIGLPFLAAFVLVTSALFGCGGAVSTTDGQPPSVPSETGAGTTATGTATLAWSAPTTNVDGTQLTSQPGYKIYYGTTPGFYTSRDVGTASSYQVVGLTKGQTYYFTVTAYDYMGNESDFAPVVSKTII